MKKLYIGLTVPLMLLFFVSSSQVQTVNVDWDNAIGGSSHDIFEAIVHTSDGGYILGGSSLSNTSGDKTEDNLGQGTYDYWVVKLDASGNVVWDNTIGGDGVDELHSLIQTIDGGYLLGGFSRSGISGDKTESNNGLLDYWVVKLDALGNITWQNTIGGDRNDELYSMVQINDGGYILGGISMSNISGDKTKGFVGSSYNYDYWIVKIDATGTVVWDNTIGGDKDDFLRSIKQTSDGGYILGGYSESDISGDKTENSRNIDYWVVKLNANGSISWQNTLGGTLDEYLFDIDQTSDGGYIIAGYSESGISGDKTEPSRGFEDYWAVKLTSTGTIDWQRGIGGADNDELQAVVETDDGFFLAGHSNSDVSGDKTQDSFGTGTRDFWGVQLNETGQILWQITTGTSSNEYIYAVDKTSDGGLIAGGITWSNLIGNGVRDYWAIKLSIEEVDTTVTTSIIEGNVSEVLLYPNPATSSITLESNISYSEVRLTDITGKIIFTYDDSISDLEIPTENLDKGVYFISYYQLGKHKVMKVLKD